MLANKKPLLPVILSGGVGSRLWPLSREQHPKPFIKLSDGESLLQKTYRRSSEFAFLKEILTVTNRDLFFYSKDEYEDLDLKNLNNTFLLEPVGRNSTAAIATAAHYAAETHGQTCLLLILASDHLIKDLDAMSDAVHQACNLAEAGQLVTFGIKPTKAETAYGYIEANGNNVKQFVEKPDQETAEMYFNSKKFLWNSGMFCSTAGKLISELNKFYPEISKKSKLALDHATKSSGSYWDAFELSDGDFSTIENISIDYSIFEKSKDISVVETDIGWSDIGSWNEFGELFPQDELGNRIDGDVLLENCQRCIIKSDSRLVVGLNIQDLIVSDTSDALLISSTKNVQDVRKITKALKGSNRTEYALFPKVHRPWGTYTVLQEGDGFKVKRIEVKPNAKLSLQSHLYRSEHWVVVNGIANVTNGEDYSVLKPNQSTYIPAGNKHRLENLGEKMLVLIEVQSGSYLGEDDIQRFNDVYGRP